MNAAPPWPPLQRSLVAILRGIRPQETADVVGALLDAGFEAIEIPLNSPDPFASIEIAVNAASEGVLIGAGTVLSPEEVDRLSRIGGRLVVSPNADPSVIKRSEELGLVSMPGVFTATEAFSALRAGATGLKFFPASVLGASGIAAIRAVLPPATETAAVGGVSHDDFAAYAKAFGGYGETVTRTEDFGPAFDRAVASGKPAILEIQVDPQALTPVKTLDQIRAGT